MEPEKTARKAIDVIYKDILGDINAILDKIDLQEKRVLSGTQDLTKNIREIENLFTTFHEETLAVVGQQMADTQEILRRAIDAQVLAATETAKNDIQLAAIGFLREIGAEVGRTVQNAVHNHLDETVSELKKQMAVVTKEAEIAQNKLIRGLSEAKTRVDEVQPQAKWEIFAYGLVGSAIGSIAMVIAISFGGIHIS